MEVNQTPWCSFGDVDTEGGWMEDVAWLHGKMLVIQHLDHTFFPRPPAIDSSTPRGPECRISGARKLDGWMDLDHTMS